MRGRTVIVITHRTELARRANRVVSISLKPDFSLT
jgi:ABC-type lipoprotein export system ATPase subunit